MLTRMLQRRGTSAQWEDVKDTLILASGEIGIIVDNTADNGKFKIGDGTTLWKDLSFYFNDSQDAAKYAQLTAAQTFVGSQVLTPNDRLVVPLVVAGASSQSANLQVWKNSSDVILASVNKDGDISAKAATFDGIVNVNSHKITNVADPTSDGDAVNKLYVDAAINGLAWKAPVNLVSYSGGSFVNVPLTGNTGTISLDGHTALTQAHGNGYRLLLLAQTTSSENGIYDYTDNGTTYTLTRSDDSDTYQELIGASVFVEEGTVYGTSSWVQKNHYITSFSGQNWVKFNGASATTAGAGMVANGNIFDVVGTADRITANADSIDIASTYVGQTSITTLGTVTTGTWNANKIEANKGGTGQSSYTAGDILYASGTSQLSKLAAGTSDYVLRSAGPGNAPTWGQVVTASLANSTGTSDGVTYAKMQYLSADHRVLGRLNGGSGNVEELTADALLAILNTSSELVSYNILPVGTTAGTVAIGNHTHTINDLSDVVITGTPVERQVIKFNGQNWINELPSGGISVGATPPANAAQGDAWFDSTDGSLYVRYDDGVGGNLTPISPVAPDSLSSAWTSGYLLVFSYSGTYNPSTLKHTISYSYELKTNSSSFFTNMTLTGGLSLDGVTVWSPSGQYSLAQSSTLVLASGTIQRSFNTSASNYLDITASIQGSMFPPFLTVYASIPLSTGSAGSSAQWVQVKANSALEASILTRMSAVEARSTKIEAANAVRVANQAERDSVYPAPVQGNTVFRADLGYEEKYYAAYDATTNPDGTTGTVGWYRYAGGAPLSQNYMINGALDIWQRGTSFAPVANTAFTADRWQAQASLVSTSRTIQQIALSQAISGLENVQYYLRSTVNTIGTGTNTRLRYKVEDATTLAGKTVTFSWYGKQNTAGNYRVLIQQNFGTGGSTSVTAYDANTTYSTTWQRYSVTFALPSVSGKTIASDSFIQIELFQGDTTGSVLEVTGFQLEEGPVATPFRRNQNNIQAELAACQRYFQPIIQGASDINIMLVRESATQAVMNIKPVVAMRVAPTLYNTSGAVSVGTAIGRIVARDTAFTVAAQTANYSGSYAASEYNLFFVITHTSIAGTYVYSEFDTLTGGTSQLFLSAEL